MLTASSRGRGVSAEATLSMHRTRRASQRRQPRHRGGERAFLIDGNAFCYRAFYAIRELSTSAGRPTNAIYGFITMLQALQAKEQPDYLAVAFDTPKPTFRHERFKDYKGHRPPMPEPLVEQLPTIREFLQAVRIPLFAVDGYEAEDVLATLAKQVAGPAVEVYLVTGDKDLLQLVDSHIKVYAPKPHEQVYDAHGIQERYGVTPAQMADLLALMGDTTDHIPAVPGIGPKTAAALLEAFGSVEELLAHLDRVANPTVRTALTAHTEQIRMAQTLTRIDPTVPLHVTLEQLRCQSPDVETLRKLYRALEFKALLKKLAPASDVELTAGGPLAVLTTSSDALLHQACQATAVACVPCWGSRDSGGLQVTGLVLVWDTGRLYAELSDEQAWRRLEAFWRAGPPLKIWHNWKPMKRLLMRHDLPHGGRVFDTLLAGYLLNPAQTHPALEDMAAQYLARELRWESADIAQRPLEDAQHVAAAAGAALLQLAPRLQEELAAKALRELYETVELPLLEVLATMEAHGICVDTDQLAALSRELHHALEQLQHDMRQWVGDEVNLNSPRQLAHVLFEELKLPVVKRTKTGPSTDAETLATLASQHELPAKLVAYRELTKLKSTYVDPLPHLRDPATGRIHTTFHQTATATGRLSSSDPNLQNIPIRTDWGRRIRCAFVPAQRGWVLLSADYSQVELRVLAHLSGDPTLRQAFHEGRDIHRYTASLIYGVGEPDVAPEMRTVAKTVNFGVIYGMEAHGLARELGIAREEAQAFIEAYFARYPRVAAYAREQVEQARQHGYVTTILGRRRYIPELNSPQGSVRQFGERAAMNAPIQGSAADLIKLAMLAIHRTLDTEPLHGRMLLQVHDELLFEVPQQALAPLSRLVQQAMSQAMRLEVPLVVTLKTGPNWAELRELT